MFFKAPPHEELLFFIILIYTYINMILERTNDRVRHIQITMGLLIVAGIFFSIPAMVSAATITVDSDQDTTIDADGDCTFREAILNANAETDLSDGDCVAGSGTDTIVFSAPMTIILGADISVASPVNIDGISGDNGVCATKNLGIVLDGGEISLGGSADGSTIHGLVIKNYPIAGVRLTSNVGTTVSCNIIGLDETGTVASGGQDSIIVSGGSNNTIGGSLNGDGNVIAGNTNQGISLSGASGTNILGNIIGLDVTGTVSMSTQTNGITIDDSPNTVIGGTGQYERNVISGNESTLYSHGIYAVAGDNSNLVIQGNYIGTDITGMIDLGNAAFGIFVGDPSGTYDGLIIGGSSAGEGNVVSANDAGGIAITGGSVENFLVQGNYIGLDATGSNVLSNSDEDIETDENAIEIEDFAAGTVGGTTATSRNYIAGTSGRGIKTGQLTGAPEIFIIGNYIGLDVDGDSVGGMGIGIQLGNGGDSSNVVIGGSGLNEGNVIAGSTEAGIQVSGSGVSVVGNKIGTNTSGVVTEGYGNDVGIIIVGQGSKIGGSSSGDGNIIAGNTSAGIILWGHLGDFPEDVSILGNSIFSNNSIGIDLIEDYENPIYGHTANDTGDADLGPNGYLNHPVITAINPETATITYNLDVPTGYYRVEFFTNPTSGISSGGYGEGETYVAASDGVQSVGSALTGQTFVMDGGIEITDDITATVTECTDVNCTTFLATSEFSNSVTPVVPTAEEEEAPSSGGGGSGGIQFGCSDLKATNYKRFVAHRQSLCTYPPTLVPSTASILGSGQCPASLAVSDSMKQGDRNGKYGVYNRKTVTQVHLLQAHINRILKQQYNQAAGPVDGIFGPKTKEGVKRLQTALNQILKPQPPLKIDGIVGPFTKGAINNSCG